MHAEYKVPGGKLVTVDLDTDAGMISHARVAGDFFLEPDEALDAINAALEGSPQQRATRTLRRLLPVLSPPMRCCWAFHPLRWRLWCVER